MKFLLQDGNMAEVLPEVVNVMDTATAYLDVTSIAALTLHLPTTPEIMIALFAGYFIYKGIKWFLKAYHEEKDTRIEVLKWAS